MTPIQNPDLSSLEEKIRIKFKDQKILRNALIHRSFLNENPEEPESNERLEFLGDAVLEFVVSEHLYKEFPSEDEGHLTTLRSRLVNTTSLSETAKILGLGEMLYLSRGEEKGEGRQSTSLLANTTEALIGAIFIDQGVKPAKAFISHVILEKIPEIVKKSLKDAKSILQEYVQANGSAAPIYNTVSEIGPDHAKEFIVEVLIDQKPYAQGKGPSKQVAAQLAAEAALERWSHPAKTS